MPSHFAEGQPLEVEKAPLNARSSFAEAENLVTKAPLSVSEFTFHSHFEDCMEMYAEAECVAAYLDAHQNWFTRCAHPMKVEPLGQNAYALVIGRFGAFGYEVEPKIGLELLPQDHGVYHILTVPVPDYVAPGYEIDFKASQAFVEVPTHDYLQQSEAEGKLPPAITLVKWHLDLTVALRFPRFVHRLPQSLIQSTGDRLLHQIVRQVSRRLTDRVQEDFHASLGIPMPQSKG